MTRRRHITAHASSRRHRSSSAVSGRPPTSLAYSRVTISFECTSHWRSPLDRFLSGDSARASLQYDEEIAGENQQGRENRAPMTRRRHITAHASSRRHRSSSASPRYDSYREIRLAPACNMTRKLPEGTCYNCPSTIPEGAVRRHAQGKLACK
ncbi:hypothetical protein KIN20_022531 [Parelaphostrongylus tenuis]|uniref:Uncharacterized protein n=1 Tax=Parelaphostrongylus tenuis TaxID=148309 RepID=A0AAD5MVN0_PARTN|nr:hypothetical protein KIN20_022531 [Parelaphostrongylus tenuis]